MKREDIFRLPPLTMDEAKVINTIVQMNLNRVEEHPTNPELWRKIKVLDKQISTVMDLMGKRVKPKKVDPYDPDIQGEVIGLMTAEEDNERDWEDMDDFDESKRGTMLVTVRWDGTEASEGQPCVDKGHLPEELEVVES